MKIEGFGAKASIYIKYNGDIASLTNKIGKVFVIKDFSTEVSEWPPHNTVSSFEECGWEGWVEASEKHEGYHYIFTMETWSSHEEIMDNRMHDLSYWLAKVVSSLCNLETLVAEKEGRKEARFPQ